jgi:hypothetical protein
LNYVPALEQFPLASASLAQGIHDPYRDLCKFTDAKEAQVFSKSREKWLSQSALLVKVGKPNGSGRSRGRSMAASLRSPIVPPTPFMFSILRHRSGFTFRRLNVRVAWAALASFAAGAGLELNL